MAENPGQTNPAIPADDATPDSIRADEAALSPEETFELLSKIRAGISEGIITAW
jgi:hypothetical protein